MIQVAPSIPSAQPGEPFVIPGPNRTLPESSANLKKLAAAYKKAGEPFFLLAGEVGVGGIYHPDARWLVPKDIASRPRWDRWIRDHLAPLVKVDPSLDKLMPLVSPEALAAPTFYHTGDLGDIIAALPVIREMGGGDLVIGNHTSNPAWRKMEGARFEALRPLLEIQPYLTDVRFDHGAPFDYELEFWRKHHRKDRTLTESQASYLRQPMPSMDPWITGVKPAAEARGMIVVARTPRYQNPLFPWRYLTQRHQNRMLFIGTAEEHESFNRDMSCRVVHAPTTTLLEVAELIAGSSLFIGNQSAPCWIAMGMGHLLIQETSPATQDSIVHRPNAQFFLTGRLVQPEVLSFDL